MAKQPPSKGGTSRIRFIMLEAEIPDGDLSQVTSAIQNALKPATVIQQRFPSQRAIAALVNNGGDSDILDEEAIEVEEQEEITTEATKSPRAPRVRRPTTPEVLEIDLITELSLESFAEAHPAKSELERNLVIAAWFKEHRDTVAVTAAHVYTCYRSLKWPVGFEDFSWPLRALKKDKLMSSPARGEYVINHLGLDRVRKMGKGSE